MERHYITNIKINKLRHLENINICLDEEEPRHLLLTGKNGVGKTTTLNAIKKWLKCLDGQYIQSVRFGQENIKKLLLKLKNEKDENQIFNIKSELNEAYNLINQLSNKDIDLKFHGDENQLNTLYKQGDFILAYYGSNRQTKVEIPKSVDKIKLQESYSFDENPSKIFVKYLLDLKTQQSFARNENELEIVENIGQWFLRFDRILKTILDDDSVMLKFDYKNYGFKIIQDNREPHGFNELSDGYSSIINIVSDLILRMDKNRASEESNYAFDKEGIVLIDELETHLHIDLQKKILPFLTEIFPKVQFIVTTHSPFVLNSIDNAVVYDLENRIRIEDLSSYSYDGIVESYFNVDNYSNELKTKIKEYEKLAFKDNLSDDEKARRAELRIEFKNISKDVAQELKDEFNVIEQRRKQLNDSYK